MRRRCATGEAARPPDYRDVRYIEELIGPDTVITMPRKTIEAVRSYES